MSDLWKYTAVGLLAGFFGAMSQDLIHSGRWNQSDGMRPTTVVKGLGPLAPSSKATAFDFADLVEQSQPSVVQVKVDIPGRTSASIKDPDHPLLDLLKKRTPRSLPEEDDIGPEDTPSPNGRSLSLGSGFFIDDQGYLLTNAHVIGNGGTVTLRLQDSREVPAKIVGVDARTDVAVLKVDSRYGPFVPLRMGDPDQARVGEWVIAIGSPFGFQSTATAGILSGKNRTLNDANYLPFLQTDAAVNPGNSGGPLLSQRGEVIGINTQIYSSSGGYEGVSFSIPIDYAISIAQKIQKNGSVSHGRVGAVIQELTPELATALKVSAIHGAVVLQVEPGSPAEKAGLLPGDALLKVDGKALDNSLAFVRTIAQLEPGSKIIITLSRKGRVIEVPLTVGAAPTVKKQLTALDVEAPDLNDHADLPYWGLQFQAEDKGGLRVTESTGLAAEIGIRKGDVLVSANGEPLKGPQDLNMPFTKSEKQPIALLARRSDRFLFLVIPARS